MIQAVLLAGDRGASRRINGESKAFLPLAGRPMLAHVLDALLDTPRVGEVFVVGDPVRVEKVLVGSGCLVRAAQGGCPVHVVPQRRSLLENVWHTFGLALPPGSPDPSRPILVVPADVPFATPEEISDFLERAFASGADYAIGLSPREALDAYAPQEGRPGIEMAYFNVREGRYRQSNLHFVRPLKMGNRQYIQDMYENRYQKEWGSMLRLIWRVVSRELHNLWVLGFYLVMHVAGVLHRRGWSRASDRVRRFTSLDTVARGIGALLRIRIEFVVTELGGAALDVDNAEDLAAAEAMFESWKARQARLAGRAPEAGRGADAPAGEAGGADGP